MTVSVCFPWRADPDRDRLATWILRRWALLFPDYELVLGACDDGPFNRSQAINDAFARSSGDIIIVADLDTIFHAHFVEEAVTRVESDPNAWGFGFSEYIKLTPSYTDWVLRYQADITVLEQYVEAYESSSTTTSGLLAISREGFTKVGGFDARFVGWGWEDVAFTDTADRLLSPHFRVEDGYLLHLWHEMSHTEANDNLVKDNQRRYQENYLGLYAPDPPTLPDGVLGEPYQQQLSVRNRIPPNTWTATGLPPGIELDPDGEICGTPTRTCLNTVIVNVVDAEGASVSRTFPPIKIVGPLLPQGIRKVGVYSSWDETFEHLMERLRWATPALDDYYNNYKTLHFVPATEPHDFALVFNAVNKVSTLPKNTYVLIFEPPEIIGPSNRWLTDRHPQASSNIFMFGGGSIHEQVLGLHIPQATLSPPETLPSRKPHRCSMICSDKTVTPYQKKRREVLVALQKTGLDIHFYGRNMRTSYLDPRVEGEIDGPTKDEALRPYTFVIDFENTHRDVVTDKFIDPILNGAVPITNSTGAAKAFPSGSFEYVDFDWPVEKIVAAIGAIITQKSLTQYDKPVAQARRLVSAGPLNICEWLYRKIEQL